MGGPGIVPPVERDHQRFEFETRAAVKTERREIMGVSAGHPCRNKSLAGLHVRDIGGCGSGFAQQADDWDFQRAGQRFERRKGRRDLAVFDT